MTLRPFTLPAEPSDVRSEFGAKPYRIRICGDWVCVEWMAGTGIRVYETFEELRLSDG